MPDGSRKNFINKGICVSIFGVFVRIRRIRRIRRLRVPRQNGNVVAVPRDPIPACQENGVPACGRFRQGRTPVLRAPKGSRDGEPIFMMIG
jgi:hypothetical protein